MSVQIWHGINTSMEGKSVLLVYTSPPTSDGTSKFSPLQKQHVGPITPLLVRSCAKFSVKCVSIGIPRDLHCFPKK